MYTLFYVIMLYTIIGPIIAIVIIIVIIVVTIEVSFHLITLLIALPIDWYIILTDCANMFYLQYTTKTKVTFTNISSKQLFQCFLQPHLLAGSQAGSQVVSQGVAPLPPLSGSQSGR